jgi:Domain of unknown function (DUF3471)
MKKVFLILSILLCYNVTFGQDSPKKESNLGEYVGNYKMETFFEIAKINTNEGNLYAEMDNNGGYKLLPYETTDCFKSTSSYGSIFSFIRDSNGKVIGLKLKILESEIEGKKIE